MMSEHVILLSIPGLRQQDLARMPRLSSLVAGGDLAALVPSFPAVTWPVQANMLTGQLPAEHGVVANGFFWRDSKRVEMWTAGNDKILAPQIWDLLHRHDPKLTSAVWFPMLSKQCGADYIAMPAPIHNPDGSESLWCYTRPTELYGELRDALGHFPLQHFWGPLANIKSTAWIVDSAQIAAARYQPRFFFLYLPHLDYAAQKLGPDSESALNACGELDQVIGKLVDDFTAAYGNKHLLWLIASEYTIVPVDHVTYPNRVLREAGLLQVRADEQGLENLDLEQSRAWALVDHQFSHVFVSDANDVGIVAELFRRHSGIAEVLVGDERDLYHMDHERSGEVLLVSERNSWQAYYWWLDDALAPAFARTVDIHRKPGYDPVELHFDMATRSVPLDATLIRGSHGAPARHPSQRGVLLSSQKGVFVETALPDTDVCEIVLRQFGI
ncbi:MAG: alkaline phosphatase family protein [Planctomycetales bacterium]|nr:alkaline phosphatase family protein [Planctomycetales bacterium]